MVLVNARPSSTVVTTLDAATGSPIFLHGIFKFLTVLCFLDGLSSSTDQSYIMLFQGNPFSSSSMARFRPAWPPRVGRTLSGFSFQDKLLYHFYCKRLNINTVCNIFICHNGCRIGVQKNNLQAFFFQRTAGLCSCIVKLCCLADDDRAGTNNKYFLMSLFLGIIYFLPSYP